MNASLFVWLAVTLVALFALVISAGLRFRRRSFQSALQLRAQDIWMSVQDSRWNFNDLLYGILQDFSSTQLGVIVRDCRDQEVGRISFHAGIRQAWVTFETGGETFQADSLPTLRQATVLHRSGEASPALCTFRRLAMGTFQVEVEGFGTIASQPPLGPRLAPRYEFVVDGRTVGASQHIGGWHNRGIWLVLPSSIPLPVRIFMLAIQRLRM